MSLESLDIHVVAGILEAPDGSILLAQRPPGKSLAGAWEFPGGKLDESEDRLSGLARELREELGIAIKRARPLIRYRYTYPDLSVHLDAWHVTSWQGEPVGQEGQAIAWRDPGDLLESGLLPADLAIVQSLQLPSKVPVTPYKNPRGEDHFVDTIVRHGSTFPLICVRRPDLKVEEMLGLEALAASRLKSHPTRFILHGDPPQIFSRLNRSDPVSWANFHDKIAGFHVPARGLLNVFERPVSSSMLFGVSCHGVDELLRACDVGADYAFLGNVRATPSHAGQPGIGWETFEKLVRDLPLPVYAIGGLGPEDLETAWAHGAQGIAAIRSLWPKD